MGHGKKNLPKGKRGARATNSVKVTAVPVMGEYKTENLPRLEDPAPPGSSRHFPLPGSSPGLFQGQLHYSALTLTLSALLPDCFICVHCLPQGDYKILEGRHFAFMRALDSSTANLHILAG